MPMSVAASMESLSAAKSMENMTNVGKDPKPVDTRYRKRGAVPYSFRAALSAVSFLIMTLIYILDLASDVWVIAVFAMDSRMARLGFSIVIFAFASIAIGFLYVFNIKKLQPQLLSMAMALCMCINFPLHLGILYERLEHQIYKFSLCCKKMADQHIVTKDWIFAKLKLAHATFQSAPFVIMNIVTILQDYPDDINIANQIGGFLSLLSLVFSTTLHEVNRKHYQQERVIGMSRVFCIFLSSFILILARVLAIGNFAYYYRAYLAAIILGHIIIVFLYFVAVYRNVWKINLGRIALHTLYCTFSYFPIHNDYRPDGEIMAYYVIYMIENIIMVALPFRVASTAVVNPQLKPGTQYYTGLTIIALFGSAVGLVLLGIYYFCLHRERQTIRDDHMACFGVCCSCCRADVEQPKRRPIYVDPTNASTTESRLTAVTPTTELPTADQPFLNDTQAQSGPPAYTDISVNNLKNEVYERSSATPLNDSDEIESKTPLTSSTPSANGERTPTDVGEAYGAEKEATVSMAARLEQLRAQSQNKNNKKKSFNPFKKSKS